MGKSSKQSTSVPPPTKEELRLLQIAADTAEVQLEVLRAATPFQKDLFAAAGPQFNETFYLKENPEVAPLIFDEAFYLRENPEVAEAIARKVDPDDEGSTFFTAFEHFDRFGRDQGRAGNALDGDVQFETALDHFTQIGQTAGLKGASPRGEFDPNDSLINQQIALLQEQVPIARELEGVARSSLGRAADAQDPLAALRARNLGFLGSAQGSLSNPGVGIPFGGIPQPGASGATDDLRRQVTRGLGFTGEFGGGRASDFRQATGQQQEFRNQVGESLFGAPPPQQTGLQNNLLALQNEVAGSVGGQPSSGLGISGGAGVVGTQQNPARPGSVAELQAFPSGIFFIDETGQVRRKR